MGSPYKINGDGGSKLDHMTDLSRDPHYVVVHEIDIEQGVDDQDDDQSPDPATARRIIQLHDAD